MDPSQTRRAHPETNPRHFDSTSKMPILCDNAEYRWTSQFPYNIIGGVSFKLVSGKLVLDSSSSSASLCIKERFP